MYTITASDLPSSGYNALIIGRDQGRIRSLVEHLATAQLDHSQDHDTPVVFANNPSCLVPSSRLLTTAMAPILYATEDLDAVCRCTVRGRRKVVICQNAHVPSLTRGGTAVWDLLSRNTYVSFASPTVFLYVVDDALGMPKAWRLLFDAVFVLAPSHTPDIEKVMPDVARPDVNYAARHTPCNAALVCCRAAHGSRAPRLAQFVLETDGGSEGDDAHSVAAGGEDDDGEAPLDAGHERGEEEQKDE